VQQWIDDPEGNFGVVIKGYLHRMTVSYSFWSSQGPLAGLRPEIEIEYELPQ